MDRDTPPLKFDRIWLALGAGFVALVVYLSLSTSTIDAGRFEDVKVGHFIAYFWLMFWYSQIFRGVRPRIALAVGFALMGVGLEYLQAMTGYRTFGYSDMRDNALGVLTGLALGWGAPGTLLARLERFHARRHG
jgi:hypothetical protein